VAPRGKKAAPAKKPAAAVGPGVVGLEVLVPDPENARAHSERNLAAIEGSLRAFGPARSIAIDEGGRVLAGNGVTEAAARVGIKRLRVVRARPDELVAVQVVGLTEAQKQQLGIADNRTAELASWLPDVLARRKAEGLDLAGLFTDAELAAIVAQAAVGRPGKTDPDTPTPPAASTTIKPGQMFRLGRHVLRCGDAREPEEVRALIRAGGGLRASVMATDPPYGVAVATIKRGMRGFSAMRNLGELANDALSPEETLDLHVRAFEAARDEALEDRAAWYVWYAVLHDEAPAAMRRVGVSLHRQIIWRKGRLVLTRSGMYHWSHECCLYGWRPGLQPAWLGSKKQVSVWEGIEPEQQLVELVRHELERSPLDVRLDATAGGVKVAVLERGGRKVKPRSLVERALEHAATFQLRVGAESTVWEVGRDPGKAVHTTQKPVELYRRAYRNHTGAGGVVFEPFCGSGTALIAGEELGLSVRALELDPKYVQAEISRWEAFTGEKAEALA
jgi:DNA modification methylase